MQKSALIARCLLNSSMVSSLEVGERIVREVYDDSFPGQDFAAWDAPLHDTTAQSIIDGVGRAMRINVRRFIVDLTLIPDQSGPNENRSSDHDDPVEPGVEPGPAPESVRRLERRFDGRS